MGVNVDDCFYDEQNATSKLNIFPVIGPLLRESTGHQWFPSQRPVTRSCDRDQRKHQSSASLAFVRGPVTGEFPAQMASNAEMFPFDDVVMINNCCLETSVDVLYGILLESKEGSQSTYITDKTFFKTVIILFDVT